MRARSFIHEKLILYRISFGRSSYSSLIVKNMKAATCECGHEEAGATEKDVMTKMESHMRNEHPALASDMKKMLKKSEKTMRDAVASM